jgi:flagellar hook assembly protein FlgD
MPEPPVIITGGSITVQLNPDDFPAAQRESKSNASVKAVEIRDENGQVVSTVPLPKNFKLTLIRANDVPK